MADEFTKAALYGIKTFNKKVKEKIGMEKLIELLNEYETTLEPNEQIEWTENGVKATPLTIISKQYGFIKWLVDNEKIDFELDRIIHKHKGIDYNTGKGIAVEKLCNRYESLLMLLSISNSPIEDLILNLK